MTGVDENTDQTGPPANPRTPVPASTLRILDPLHALPTAYPRGISPVILLPASTPLPARPGARTVSTRAIRHYLRSDLSQTSYLIAAKSRTWPGGRSS